MTMKELPAEQRPREKLLARGAGALADTELLALLLRTGIKGKGVFAMAEQVLAAFDGFHGLLQADANSLKRIKGLGPAKRAELMAVMEMARRALAQQLKAAPVLSNLAALKDFVALKLAGEWQEVFSVLFLDAHQRLLRMDEMFRGGLTQTSVYPREIVRRALETNASCIVFAHNHPSGVAEPSRADDNLTQTLKSALLLIDVRVLDHLIVGRGVVVSMAERGLM